MQILFNTLENEKEVDNNKLKFYKKFSEEIFPKNVDDISKIIEAKQYTGLSLLMIVLSIFASIGLFSFSNNPNSFLLICIPIVITLINPRTYSLFPKNFQKNDNLLNISDQLIEDELPGFNFYHPGKTILETKDIQNIFSLSSGDSNFFKINKQKTLIYGEIHEIPVTIRDLSIIGVEKRKGNNGKTQLNEKDLMKGILVEIDFDLDEDFQMVLFPKRHKKYTKLSNHKNFKKIKVSDFYLEENYQIGTNDEIKLYKILEPRIVENIIKLSHFENLRFKESLNLCFRAGETRSEGKSKNSLTNFIHSTTLKTIDKTDKYGISIKDGKLYIFYDVGGFEFFNIGERLMFQPELIWNDIEKIKHLLEFSLTLELDDKI